MFIKKTLSCLDEDTLLMLYRTLVRAHLEYGIIIWYPHYQTDKLAVEKVQHQVTKLVPHLKHLSYEERLVALRLQSLLFRRRGDMIQVYKIMNGVDRLDPRALWFGCSGIIPGLSLNQHSLYAGVVEKSPPPPLTGEQYGKMEPKYPEGGHCQSVLRPQGVFNVPLYFK